MKWCDRIRLPAEIGLCLLALLGAVWAPAAHARETTLTVLKRCDACHTPNGRLYQPWMPFIYGQPQSYIHRMLHEYQSGRRPSNDMYDELGGYTDKELDELSRLVSQRAPVEIKQETDRVMAAIGSSIYEARCIACHPDEGRGSEFESAILAGQPLLYLRHQFAAILERRRPALYMMQDNYIGLGEDDFEALAHFFASRDRRRAATQNHR